MEPRLLRKKEIAKIFGTSPESARTILARHGVSPIDLGLGRGLGLRWLESAVMDVVLSMHANAQVPRNTKTENERGCWRRASRHLRIQDMPIAELYELTRKGRLQ